MKYQFYCRLLFCVLLLNACFDKEIIRHEALLDKHKYPSDYMFLQRAYPHGKIDKAAYRKGYQLAQKLKQKPSSREGEWKNEGPLNIGGRIVDIEKVGSTLYVGAASGGVFSTDDNGNTWRALFDNEATLAIGDIAISAQDEQLLYVGTGEANAGGGSLAYDGEGMYKSIDGGMQWSRIGLEDVGSIGRVAIDPTDDNTVYVAAMGTLFAENIERGIYRTKDGGESWEKVLYVTPKTGAIDVAIDPSNPQIIYAALWERERLLYDRTYGGPTSGIYKSIDGGDNWTKLTNGLPTENMGRIGISIAPSNPNVLYATITRASGNLLGIYKTNDKGASWELKNIDGIQNVSYMYWFGRIKVDPTDENTIYHVGFRMRKSTDSSESWELVFSGVHVDQHEVWINPDNPNQVYIGNDGGVYYSTNGGISNTKIDNIPITQFYRCEIDYLQPERLYGGSQDNSTMRTLTGSNNDWSIIYGGDGFTPLVDPTDNTYVYVSSQYGNFRRSVDGGFSFTSATVGIPPSDPNNWNSPYVFDPNNPEIIYFGTNKLYRSTDRAETWTLMSPDLSNGPYVGVNPFGTLTSISVSPHDPNQILVGTDDGNVWITDDQGGTWLQIDEELPNRWVTSVNHHPTIANRMYVTFSGYRYGETAGYVYEMNYPENAWTSIDDGLPQVPVNDLLVIPKTEEIVVATDVGVFITNEDMEWENLGNVLPNVVINDLDYHDLEDKLIVATYGRSMYTYSFERDVTSTENQKEISFKVYPNPASSYVNIGVKSEIETQKVWIAAMDGRKIKTRVERISDSEVQMDLSDLKAGVYILNLETPSGILSERITKI
ncbi:MAG: T9SS type A sorting domain-containing protein [Saprospiraceae bacterium]|nr:T9SS type A sorting domain-containing protein [Saprospiraceae bacterium]